MQLSAPSDCILLFYAIINRMICAYQIRFLFTSSTYSADLLYSSVNLRSPASGGAKDVEHECEHPRYVNVLSNMLIKRGGRTRTRSTLKSHCFLRNASQTPCDAPLVAPLRVASILQVGRKTILEHQTTCNGVLIVYFRPFKFTFDSNKLRPIAVWMRMLAL